MPDGGSHWALSMIAQAIDWPILTPLTQTSGTSDSAERLAELLRGATEHQRLNASDWRTDLRAKIEELAAECSSHDWDSYGARRISDISKRNALSFVDL